MGLFASSTLYLCLTCILYIFIVYGMSSEFRPNVPVVYGETYRTNYNTVDCENPDRVTSIYHEIGEIAEFREPKACPIENLALCHAASLIESVRRQKDVFEVAALAAGGAIEAAYIALERPSFALIRPPGHHAGYNFNGGFCFFNNMAVALRTLMARESVGSALIIDIDLHYGNGTFDIVKDDGNVVFKNISAVTRQDFFDQLDESLLNASQFDIVGCSAGFDTYVKDWGGLLCTEDFRKISYRIASSNRRFFSLLEGGYYLPDLGINVRSYLQGIQDACLS
jgi:acetoin utilization deacetylase AcuC-like enzyme